MNIKINCTYNVESAWCNNKNIKRSLFGIGTRCCKEFNGEVCTFKCEHKRPPPPPVVPKPPQPRLIIENGKPPKR